MARTRNKITHRGVAYCTGTIFTKCHPNDQINNDDMNERFSRGPWINGRLTQKRTLKKQVWGGVHATGWSHNDKVMMLKEEFLDHVFKDSTPTCYKKLSSVPNFFMWWFNSLIGRVMAQAPSRWPLTTEDRIRSQASQRECVIDKRALGQVFIPGRCFPIVIIILPMIQNHQSIADAV